MQSKGPPPVLQPQQHTDKQRHLNADSQQQHDSSSNGGQARIRVQPATPTEFPANAPPARERSSSLDSSSSSNGLTCIGSPLHTYWPAAGSIKAAKAAPTATRRVLADAAAKLTPIAAQAVAAAYVQRLADAQGLGMVRALVKFLELDELPGYDAAQMINTEFKELLTSKVSC